MKRSTLLSALAAKAAADCTFSNVYGDHMVLQRLSNATMVHGFGTPGDSVNVTLDSSNLGPTAVGTDGVWRQLLPSQPAGGPHTLTVLCSGYSHSIVDVLFGDVFLCGGQSNMEFTVAQAFNASVEIARADNYPNIRVMTVGSGTTSYTPLMELGSIYQPWVAASSQTIGAGNWSAFSAVCWFFGRNIFDGLGGASPIGLISSNWGGTRVQAWSTNATNAKCNTSIATDETEALAAVADDIGQGAFPPAPLHAGPGPNNASVLYNAMIYPFALGPMALHGFTWFQGEQNSGEPAVYECAFPQMVYQWKQDFDIDHSSSKGPWFGFVLMEPWVTTADLASLRDAQYTAYVKDHKPAVPKVGFGSATDIGDATSPFGSVHPRAKQIPAARLSAAALGQLYHNATSYWTGPVLHGEAHGNTTNGIMVVEATFDGLDGSPLVMKNMTPDEACPVSLRVAPSMCAWPQIFTSSNVWVNATITLGGHQDTLVFTAPVAAQGDIPTMVQYGYGVWPASYVYSGYTFSSKYETVAFPMIPFRTAVQP